MSEARRPVLKYKENFLMKTTCKFCGKEFSIPACTKPENETYSCGECTHGCMVKAAECGGKSWHSEPCISCSENPYRLKWHHNGKEWVRNE